MLMRWMPVICCCLFTLSCASSPVPFKTSANGPGSSAAVTVPFLPCAETSMRYTTDAITILYPPPSLFSPGAVIPEIEGLNCLDVFVEWLRGQPPTPWRIAVGGDRGTSFDPQTLAEKRQELLQRYFLRKGVDTSDWTWTAVSWPINGRAVQLKLKNQP